MVSILQGAVYFIEGALRALPRQRLVEESDDHVLAKRRDVAQRRRAKNGYLAPAQRAEEDLV
jgi:hypothetical protein